MDTAGLVVDAFADLGLASETSGPPPNETVTLDPAGVALVLAIERRSLVTDDTARSLLQGTPHGSTLLVVSDRVTAEARKILAEGGAGYLDLRGRLGLRTDRVVIDAEIEPSREHRETRTDALTGSVGLEVATAILLSPHRQNAVRALARELGRSPSTVSGILSALRRDGLVDSANKLSGTDLFWRVADRWTTSAVPLASVPDATDSTLAGALGLGLTDLSGPGWALTESAAAAAFGAPAAFRSGQTLGFLVPNEPLIRRAVTLLGAAPSSALTKATVRVAPVPAATDHRVDLRGPTVDWPLAHPLFVALDLAQDLGRGREILAAWTPDDERWTRVW